MVESTRLTYLFVLVVFRNLSPEPHQSVLEVLVDPKVGDMHPCVGVPATVLAARRGVHVENGVNAVLRAGSNGTVEVAEAVGFEHARVQVVIEMAVADRDADAVQAERFEERRVGLCEEVLEKLWSSMSK